jgi:ribosome-associated toxin RatA of RatAB toxin-antitoxin module
LARRSFISVLALLCLPKTAWGTTHKRGIDRYERRVPGTKLRAGGARAGVQATAAQVRGVVTDYRGYSRFIEQFERSRVVGKVGDATDLYIDIPILHGLAKVWAVVRFSPPAPENGGLAVRGRMIKGNVRRLDITWRLSQVQEDWTYLSAELLLDLKLPAPRSAVLKTVKRAAAQAVRGIRAETEARVGAS